MKTKRQFSFTLVIGVLVAAVILVAAKALPLGASRERDNVGVQRVRSVQAKPISLESTYGGWVQLNWSVPGVYSDTLTAPEGELQDLGRIDLGFLLHSEQNSLSGYVDLSNTLVFTREHTITTTQAITTPLAVGPAVHGTFDTVHGTFDIADLQLESERFSLVTNAGQHVMRQFRLTGAWDSLTTFTGEYRETVWGYGPQPLTIVGEFNLNLISGGNIALLYRIYLPLVLRQSS